jgi:hypothetical protein
VTVLAGQNEAVPPTADGSVAAAVSALVFERCVPRRLVHRRSLSEVFLTDSRSVSRTQFVAGAQLPSSHAYFTDHMEATSVDPLLLLECCRQAETHAVHTHFGAPADTKFVLQSWSLSLSGLASIGSASGPAEVAVMADTHDAQWRGTSLRALSYRMRIDVSGEHVGEARMRVQYLPDGVYDAMRRKQHGGGAPPSSDTYRNPRDEALVPPECVGRTQPDNVILVDPVVDGKAVRARLRVDGGHPSMFDHAQDHVPGMVLMEAGRQIALLTWGELTRVPPASWRISGIEADFHAYGELGEPLVVIAHQSAAVGSTGEAQVRVTFEQSGWTVAEAVFTGRSPGVGPSSWGFQGTSVPFEVTAT